MSVILWILGVMSLILESVLLVVLGIEFWGIATPLALAVVLAVEKGLGGGGLVMAGLLLPIEYFVAGVPGVYTLALVFLFLMVSLVRRQLKGGWGVARGMIAFVAGLLHGIVMMAIFWAMPGDSTHLLGAVGWSILGTAAIAAVMAVLLGQVVSRMEEAFNPGRIRGRLEM